MNTQTYRNAADKILRNRLDTKRLKRADKLLAHALRSHSQRNKACP